MFGSKHGFTLAEVLITLGIIGVVAAMTIPTLITKIQKAQIESLLKENCTNIAQTMRMAENDDVETIPIIQTTQGMKDWYSIYIAPYMKVEQVCFQQAGCWHNSGIVKTLNGATPYWQSKYGMGYEFTFKTAKGAYYSLDGFNASNAWSIFGVKTTQTTLEFYFDVNGNKKPNIIGKDIYIMVYDPNRDALLPAGYDKSKEEIENNCLSGDGYWCLAYVKSNNWKIDDRTWKRKK